LRAHLSARAEGAPGQAPTRATGLGVRARQCVGPLTPLDDCARVRTRCIAGMHGLAGLRTHRCLPASRLAGRQCAHGGTPARLKCLGGTFFYGRSSSGRPSCLAAVLFARSAHLFCPPRVIPVFFFAFFARPPAFFFAFLCEKNEKTREKRGKKRSGRRRHSKTTKQKQAEFYVYRPGGRTCGRRKYHAWCQKKAAKRCGRASTSHRS